MRLKILTDRLRKMLDMALIDDKFSDTIFRFSEKGVVISDLGTLTGIVVSATFKKDYFLEYEAEREDVLIPQSIAKMLKKTAFKGEYVELFSDDTMITIESGSEHCSEDLTLIDEIRLGKHFSTESTDYGLLPTKNEGIGYIVKVNVTDLVLPTTNTYDVTVKENGILHFLCEDIGKFERNVEPVDIVKNDVDESKTQSYNPSFFNAMVKQFEGFVYLMVDSGGAILFTEKSADHYLLYGLSEVHK